MNWMDFITFLCFIFLIICMYLIVDNVSKENEKLKRIIKKQNRMIQELKDKSS